MTTYTIEARETVLYSFEVEAESRDEAHQKVKDGSAFTNGMPDADNSTDFEITFIS